MITKENYALLVVDMQQVAFDGKVTPAIPNGSKLLNSVSTLINVCRDRSVQVIHLQTCGFPGQPYAKDVHGWEIHPDVAPLPNELTLFKTGPSGFENPELHKGLQAAGTNGVIVCGIWSEGCVAMTCQSALELNYQVCLAANGHSTVRETEVEASVVVLQENEKLIQQNARAIDIADIARELASAPEVGTRN